LKISFEKTSYGFWANTIGLSRFFEEAFISNVSSLGFFGKGRLHSFKVHTKDLKLNESVDLVFLAKQTPGFSGADIANVLDPKGRIGAFGGFNEDPDNKEQRRKFLR